MNTKKYFEEREILVLPENFKSKIKRFYENKGKQELEDFVKRIREEYNEPIYLHWDKKDGLTNICIYPDSGADLEGLYKQFVWANLGNERTKKPILEIIKKYKSLLEKIQ